MPDLDWSIPEHRKLIRKERETQWRAERGLARRAAAGFEPLKITAKLQTPIISDASLPIDGILYFIWHRYQFGRQELTSSGVSIELHGSNLLPLERRNEHVPEWFYAASWAQWDGIVTEGNDHWNCRFDTALTDYLDTPKAKLDISSGRYKSYHMPVFTRHALSVHWFVVGNMAGIRELLRFASNIGKKSAQGYGAILEWSIEPLSDDYSVRDAQGKLTRPIPSESGVFIGYRPSYWAARNQTTCEVPSL
jgi:CRISPR type IV-associated protein Csf3